MELKDKKQLSLPSTVDGRNPAPVDMVNIPLFTEFYTFQVVIAGFLPSTVLSVELFSKSPSCQYHREAKRKLWVLTLLITLPTIMEVQNGWTLDPGSSVSKGAMAATFMMGGRVDVGMLAWGHWNWFPFFQHFLSNLEYFPKQSRQCNSIIIIIMIKSPINMFSPCLCWPTTKQVLSSDK